MKVKEKVRKEAVIKIETLMDVIENPKGCFENKEKLLMIEIDKGYVSSSTAFPYTKKGKKDLLKFIKNECFL
jgi:hypothetical protein